MKQIESKTEREREGKHEQDVGERDEEAGSRRSARETDRVRGKEGE